MASESTFVFQDEVDASVPGSAIEHQCTGRALVPFTGEQEHQGTGRALVPFTGEHDDRTKEPRTAAYYAGLIDDEWRRTAEGILRIAKYCAGAEEKLCPKEKKLLIKQLPFDRPSFSKFVQIGKDRRLHQPDILALLPSKYSVVYELTKLSNRKLLAVSVA